MVNDDELGCKKYGVPLYGAAWVPPAAEKEDSAAESETPASHTVKRHVVLSGGGGEGHSGIPNALLLSAFDFDSTSLSDQPVAKLETGSDLPYRIAVHPGGEGIICSFPKSCRWFEWDSATSSDEHTLSLKSSEKSLEKLEDIGQQLAMTFNSEGSLIAIGGEVLVRNYFHLEKLYVGAQDGKLRVFKWPAMEITLDEEKVHASVKDLDFSPDGKFLVSVGSGPARIWNVATTSSVASLPKQNDERFSFCRFSRSTDTDQVLYITSMGDKGDRIIKWNTTSWKMMSSKHVSRDPVSAFNVSPDGKFLAIGTIHGDVSILSSASMRVHTVLRKAHLGIVTTLAFSLDSRALVSASLDSSARVTPIKDKKKNGMNLWTILFFILLAIAIYYARSKYFPLKL